MGKRFADGGQVPLNTYPFGGPAPQSAQPTQNVQPMQPARPMQMPNQQNSVTMYARGGKVKKYADGGKADYATPSPAIQRMMKEMEQAKQSEKAYNKSLRSEGMEASASAPMKPADKKPKAMMSGGCAKGYKKGGMIDGCAQRGKTKGRMV